VLFRSGVNGTPTFYINGVRHDDSYEPDILLDALERGGRTAVDGAQTSPARSDKGPVYD